jgi:hypothetical protein
MQTQAGRGDVGLDVEHRYFGRFLIGRGKPLQARSERVGDTKIHYGQLSSSQSGRRAICSPTGRSFKKRICSTHPLEEKHFHSN